jgi:hypothetical protein
VLGAPDDAALRSRLGLRLLLLPRERVELALALRCELCVLALSPSSSLPASLSPPLLLLPSPPPPAQPGVPARAAAAAASSSSSSTSPPLTPLGLLRLHPSVG